MRDEFGRFVKGHVPWNKMPIELICHYCGKTFRVSPSRKNYKFCSLDCRKKFRESLRIRKICPVCGKVFTTIQSKPNRKFCSLRCYRQAMAKGLVKRNAWNKGKKLPEHVREKLRKALLGKHSSPRTEFRKGHIPWWKKLGLRNLMDIPEVREKHRLNVQKWWKDPQYVAKQMMSRRTKPNRKEKRLDKVLQRNFPNEWKYVGDGQFVIGGLCPDWTNVNGKKKVIDLFGCFYHGCPEHYPYVKVKPRFKEDARRAIFKKYGFDYLVVWEHELKDERALMEKLREFTYA